MSYPKRAHRTYLQPVSKRHSYAGHRQHTWNASLDEASPRSNHVNAARSPIHTPRQMGKQKMHALYNTDMSLGIHAVLSPEKPER